MCAHTFQTLSRDADYRLPRPRRRRLQPDYCVYMLRPFYPYHLPRSMPSARTDRKQRAVEALALTLLAGEKSLSAYHPPSEALVLPLRSTLKRQVAFHCCYLIRIIPPIIGTLFPTHKIQLLESHNASVLILMQHRPSSAPNGILDTCTSPSPLARSCIIMTRFLLSTNRRSSWDPASIAHLDPVS